jgi:hypothetical protein
MKHGKKVDKMCAVMYNKKGCIVSNPATGRAHRRMLEGNANSAQSQGNAVQRHPKGRCAACHRSGDHSGGKKQILLSRVTPHKDCVSDAPSDFLSDCAKIM